MRTTIKSTYKGYNSIVKGVVVDTNDPQSLSRVKVRIPCYHGIKDDDLSMSDDNLPWAQVCLYDSKTSLQAGNTVWITFEGGDIRYPVCTGLLGSMVSNLSGGSSMSNMNISGGSYEINGYSMEGNTLAELTSSMISNFEGNYDSINGNDNGAISIGVIQWHATRAKDLLLSIKNKNPYSFSTMSSGTNLITDLSSADWNSYCVSSGTAIYTAIQSILGTTASHEIQDALMVTDCQSYINKGIGLGITDNDALMYYCDISNQYGINGAYSMVKELGSPYTLEKIHNSAVTWSGGSYSSRRNSVYNIIVEFTNSGALVGTGGEINVYPSSGEYTWPVPDSKSISSPYGNRSDPFGSGDIKFHSGIDIPAGTGTNIVATKAGTVVAASFSGRYSYEGHYVTGGSGYGNVVIIDHNEYVSLYAHQNSLNVSVGDQVVQGQIIGTVGSTGDSTGPHLHFSIYTRDGTHYDPMKFVSNL